MTPDDRSGQEPTKPLPVEPEQTPTSPTQPVVAAHVPVADLSTAPLDPIDARPRGTGDRPRALTWGLVAAVALLGLAVIVILSLYFQGREPGPAISPTPSQSPTVTPTPSDAPAPVEDPPSEEPTEPTPEPTTPPEPTDPPDPDPTGTPAAPA